MRNRVTQISGALLALVLLLAGLATMTASAAYPSGSKSAATTGTGSVSGPEVSTAVRSDMSPPLRSIAPVTPRTGTEGEFPIHPIPDVSDQGPGFVDRVVQKMLGPLAMPTPIANFEGIYNIWGGYPPDTSGDVGPNHFVQIVNVGFQVFSKTGTSLYGPANNNVLFTGFGGLCETTNRGDPVGLYDQLADRFVLSWFAFTSQSGPTSQCFAVTATPDPTGPWYRYEFAVGTAFEDYPHVGVWPDAYYMTSNTFGGGGGGGNFAMERERMLRGDPTARMVVFRGAGSGFLPSDLDGNPPPPGSPNYFMRFTGSSTLQQYRFHVDWSDPALSTFTGPVNIAVTPYDSGIGGIPQPGTSATLATLSDRLMYRLAYRNLGTHESLLANHTVDSGSDIAGIRWYEIRNPNGNPPTVYQQGTYAPADGIDRWMGSIAMDHQGNIAVGFSASSTSLYPSIRYAGRLATDPLGEMSQGEETLITGTGSQTGPSGRWGDYSQMNVDPTDDCTFWYTTEYIQVTGERTWRTRIGSFKFPGCTTAPLTPAPTSTGAPPTATPVVPTPTACAGNVSYTGSITGTDMVQTSRLVSVGLPPSTCAVPRTCPGNDTADTTQHNYDTYTYQNTTGSAQCVTVRVVQGCSNNALSSVAYLGSYDPANKCTNYIADGARGGPNNQYSFTLGAGQTAVVMVYEQNGGIGCETYTLSINPCESGGQTATPTSPAATATATSPAVSATPTQCVAQPGWVAGPAYNPPVYTQQGDVAGDGNFYVAGGQDSTNTPLNNVNRYEPATNAWVARAPLPVAVGQASVGAAGNKIYVAGGFVGGSTVTSTLQIYDIPSNSWTFGPSMPGAKEAAAGVVLNNKFYVIGGDDFNVAVDTNYAYDIVAGTWSTAAPLPAGRSNLNGTAAGGYVYTLGGVIGGGFEANDALLRYDPVANSWTAMAPAGIAGYGNYAGISPYGAGTLLGVIGGDTGFEPINRTRIYTIATNTWAEGPPMLQARMAHAQDTLPDGRVIVASGYDGSATLPGVELLSPTGACPTPSATSVVSATPTSPAATATATATSPAVTATPTACLVQFADVPVTNTFYVFVRCLACQGIVSGYPCGGAGEPCNANQDPYFRPNNPVTRGQLAKIVSESAGFDEEVPPSQYTFSDVPYGSTFWVWVERLANREVMSGYPCGFDPNEPCDSGNRPYFRPNAGATRGQLTKIVSNAAGFDDAIPPAEYTFADVPPTHTFWLFVERLLLNRPDVMSGYPCGGPGEPCDAESRPYFRPNNPLTRGQTSKIVANTFFPDCNPPRP